jgi:thymidylate synthase (FAD)
MRPTVKLIAYTTPCDPAWGRTLEEFVAYCARVSNPGNQGNHTTARKLLKYLADNAHWSPFEMAHAVLEITTTRDIARQILRHRSFSFQEFSQRYGHAMSFDDGRPLRWQDHKNRQNSITPSIGDDSAAALSREWMERQQRTVQVARDNYEWALSQGVAKEVARSVLPEGLTASRLYMSGTLRSWIHYIALRTESSTQLEHRDIADLCANALRPVAPIIDMFGEGSKSSYAHRVITQKEAVETAKAWVAKEALTDAARLEQVIYDDDITTVHISAPNEYGTYGQNEWYVQVVEGECKRIASFPL